MKSSFSIAALMLASVAFIACDEDYTDWADPQSNAQEDAIAAVSASFSAGSNSTILMDNFDYSDEAEVLKYSSASVTDATFSPSSFLVNGESFEYTYDDGSFTVAVAQLDSVVRETYQSRASTARTLTVQAIGSVIVDEQGLAVSSDEMTISLTPITTPEEDANGYYLLGDWQSWSLTDPTWMESQGDGIYTATVTTTSDGSNWYKFYEGSYYSDSDWDTVNLGQMGCITNGDDSSFGYVVWEGDTMNPDGVQTPTITGTGQWIITLDIVNMTYTITSAETETWYLVGSNIGEGNWGNDGVSNVGVSLYPLAYLSEGVVSYTGYFPVGEFKLIKTPGSWSYEWGYDSSSSTWVTSGGGNYSVETAGYYTMQVTGYSSAASFEAADEPSTTFEQMGMSGGFNSWGFQEMEVCAYNEHLWLYTLSTDEDVEVKFLSDSSWATNWGSDTFPSGTGVQNGSNIPVTAGTYIVVFNDIDGGYTFVATE